ncbi:MAG: hypothetical protein HC793_01545 [Aquincola sp.]|nr:hypothetical protein [Aquincola sp.]
MLDIMFHRVLGNTPEDGKPAFDGAVEAANGDIFSSVKRLSLRSRIAS